MTGRKTNETDNQLNISPTITPVEIKITQEPLISLTQEELKQIKIQKQADTNFGAWQKEIKDTKPWYDKLPLINTKYFVYFDLEKNKFIVQIYDKNNQDAIKTEIINNLKNLGIDTDKFEIEFK